MKEALKREALKWEALTREPAHLVGIMSVGALIAHHDFHRSE